MTTDETRLTADERACDLFDNPYPSPCAGPRFTDPQPEIDLRVCAFHLFLSRNDRWIARAENEARRADRAEAERDALR